MSKNSGDAVSSCLGLIVFVVFLIVLGIVVNGAVIATMWNWFAVPILGLPTLTLFQAYGLSLVFSSFTLSLATKENENVKKADSITEVMVFGVANVLLPAIVLLVVGWIILQLV